MRLKAERDKKILKQQVFRRHLELGVVKVTVTAITFRAKQTYMGIYSWKKVRSSAKWAVPRQVSFLFSHL